MIKLGWENRRTCFMVKCTFTVPLYVSTCKLLVLGVTRSLKSNSNTFHRYLVGGEGGGSKDVRKTQFRPGKM